MRTDRDNLVAAFGGDVAFAASAPLRDALLSKLQDHINTDGTLDAKAFDKAVKPYTRAVNMWF